jgi:hypothetical protein
MSLSHSHQSRFYFGGIGAAAGNVVALGVLATDRLRAVINMSDGVALTAEFTVSADDQINNTGGTSTAADFLLVVVDRPDPRGFTGAERF